MSIFPTAPRSNRGASTVTGRAVRLLEDIPNQRGLIFALIIIAALLAFETFNFGTTEFALEDLIGDLSFSGLRWATILAFAFCGIDFAGIARLFTPERGRQEPVEVWYLLGAWFLAATMNAVLTWWAVSLALLGHAGLGNEILGRESLLRGVPIFVAVLVWLIRVLIIGTLTLAGDRLFSFDATKVRPAASFRPQPLPMAREPQGRSVAKDRPRPVRPAPKPEPRREPTYAPDPMVARPPRRRS